MGTVARALAEPTRREIMALVQGQELSVGEIAANFAVTRPAISQHLRVLHDADLVSVRSQGNRRYYQARPEGLGELRRWLESFWRSSLATLKVEIERDLWNEPKQGSTR
jgi:DNA-binding transcriptional ArsR family regulator